MDEIKRRLNDSAAFRWSVLILVSFAMAVNYWFYDVLSPIQEDIIKNLGFSATEYGSVIAAYSIPNTFFLMAAIGGMICDKLGIRLTGSMFFSSMVVGSFLTYYGTTDYFNGGGIGYSFLNSFWSGHAPSFKMMSIGFFFFGLGAETACVVISKSIVKWFKGKELATAMGINVGIARVFSSLTFSVGAWMADPVWNRPILFGAVLMIVGFICFVAYIFFDAAFDRQAPEAKGETEEPFRFTDVFRLLVNPTYIFVALLCVTFYSAVFPFMKYAPDLMMNKFHLSKQHAAWIVSALPLAQAAITPLFGWVIDYKGKSASLMILGSICLVAGHSFLSLTDITPFVGLALIGIAFSLVPAAMWPALAKIVDENRIGTAYGLTFTIQNFGLMVTAPLIGYVLEENNPGVTAAKTAGEEVFYDYTYPILMLAVFGFIGIVFAFLLKRADKTGGYGLELPNKVKREA
jgi:MFS family permease